MSLNLQIHLKWLIETIVNKCQGQVNRNRREIRDLLLTIFEIDLPLK
jgi:hypothetical protein